MLIIIEGADCTGKTTLAKTLIQTIGEEHVSCLSKGPPAFNDPVVEYLWPLSGYIPNTKQHLICDRWHVGEMIYPKIFNRKSIMTMTEFKLINDVIRKLGGLIVYLEPPLSKVHERFNTRGDKFISDIDVLTESYIRFKVFMETEFNYEYDPFGVKCTDTTFKQDLIDAIIWTAKMREQGVDH
jgi:thymidylate kinase